MSQFQVREYRGHEQDAAKLLSFLSAVNQHPDFVTDYHIGDFVWQRFRVAPGASADTQAFWSAPDGRTVAIGWFDAPRDFAVTLAPDLAGTEDEPELIGAVADWAQGLRGEGDEPLRTTIRADDLRAQQALRDLGFSFTGEIPYASNLRALDDAIPVPELPEDFTIVEMTNDANLDDRVELHREVWAPSKFTREGYQVLRSAPVYREDLDLAVRAPDGRYASYLIAWWDGAARSGLLEPVGARAEYRQRGLTKALIFEALRRLRALGATKAYVNSIAEDGPASALYRSVGFQRIAEWQYWTRPNNPVTTPR